MSKGNGTNDSLFSRRAGCTFHLFCTRPDHQGLKDHEIVEPYVPDDHEVNYLDAGFSDACPEAFFDVADTNSIGPISTQMAVEQGKAVVDGGATKTLGSVVALEKIIALNK